MATLHMKRSQYTWVEEKKGHPKLAYNALTGAAGELSEATVRLLEKARNNAIEVEKETITHKDCSFSGYLIPENLDEALYVKMVLEKLKESASKLCITIIPTHACNMNCPYCYQQKDASVMDEATLSRILQYIRLNAHQFKTIEITWYGGEPLLQWKKICSFSREVKTLCHQMDRTFASSIVSNCSLLSPDIAHALFDAGVTNLQVTFDGPRCIHDTLRHINGDPSFDLLVRNIQHAITRFNVTIRVNVSKSNADQIPLLLDQLCEAGIHEKAAIYFAPLQRYPASSFTDLMDAQSFEALNPTFLRQAYDAGFIISLPFLIFSCEARQKDAFVIEPNGECKKCWAEVGEEGKNFACFSPSGLNLTDEKKQTKWEEFNPFQTEACTSCWLLPLCNGGCAWKEFSGVALADRCHPMKKHAREYVQLINTCMTDGGEYTPETGNLKKHPTQSTCKS